MIAFCMMDALSFIMRL